jgi:tripartite-type tricarboxylate transporter receptor subunit TctC
MKKLFGALVACLLWNGSVVAQSSFYEGKTVRIIVGFSPGAAYDAWARLMAQYWPKHIPGNPTFMVQNITGAGSIVAANHVYNLAKPDGLTMGFVSPTILIEQLNGRREVKHDWLKFAHVGSPESTSRIFFIRADSGYKNLEDLKKAVDPPKCGATGVGTASYYWPKLLADAFGLKLNVVPGYPGAADVHLAIEKGEMHCWGGTVQNYFGTEPSRTWAKTGFVRVLAQGGQKRHPQLPDVPTVWELMEKHRIAETTRGLARVLLAPDDVGRALFAPPGVPAERLRTLREGFIKTMNSSDVVAEARRRGFEPNPLSGEEIEGLVKQLVQSQEVIQRMKTFLQN